MKNDTQRSVRYTTIVFCLFAVVAAFYLLTEHRAHLLGWLPYLIFLACPLMHLFMHRSHGHGRHDENSTLDAKTARGADNPQDFKTHH